jgi:hypothetical protein
MIEFCGELGETAMINSTRFYLCLSSRMYTVLLRTRNIMSLGVKPTIGTDLLSLSHGKPRYPF